MPSRRIAIWNRGAPPEHRFCCPERRVVPGVRAHDTLEIAAARRVGKGASPLWQPGRLLMRLCPRVPTSPFDRVGKVARGQCDMSLSCGRRLCPPYGAAAVLALAVMATTAAIAQALSPPKDAEILALMKAHCVACHAAEPTHEAVAKAPAGVLLETIPQVAANAARIMTQVVVDRAMPLGNQTGMTDEERDHIAALIEGRGK